MNRPGFELAGELLEFAGGLAILSLSNSIWINNYKLLELHRYLWAYAPGAFENLKAVVYYFCETQQESIAAPSWERGIDPWFTMTLVVTRRDFSMA